MKTKIMHIFQSIALSLQEPAPLRRSDSRNSMISSVSSAVETESVATAYTVKQMSKLMKPSSPNRV